MLFVCIHSNGFGQAHFLSDFTKIEFDNLDIPIKVCDFAEDSLNNIWIASWNGLFRYDGYNCIGYDRCPSSENLKTAPLDIQQICIGQDQTVWAGTSENGIYVKKPGSSCIEPLDFQPNIPEIKTAFISDIGTDSKGRLWFTSPALGLFCYEPKTKELRKFRNSNDHSLFDLAIDKKHGKIWVWAESMNILCIDVDNTTIFETYKLPFPRMPFYANQINRINVDGNGTLWFSGYDFGLYYLPYGTRTFLKYPLPPHKGAINNFQISPDQEIFLCMDDKSKIVVSPSLNKVHIYPPELFKYPSAQLFFSRHKDIWSINFLEGIGVYFRDELKLEYLGSATENPASARLKYPILNVCPLKDGTVLLGTDEDGAYRYDPETGRFSRFSVGGDRRVIKTIYVDSQERIWFGHWRDGMTCYNPKAGSYTNYNDYSKGPYQITGPHVWAFEEDKAGNFWVSCLKNGLLRFSQDGKIRKVFFAGPDEPNPAHKIMDIECDRSGTVWVAFEEHGLGFLPSGADEFTLIETEASGLLSKNVNFIFEDNNSNIWVGTNAGLNLWNNGRFLKFTSEDGLLDNDVKAMVEDNDGNLWVSTTKGIALLKLIDSQWRVHARTGVDNANSQLHLSACATSKNKLFFGGVFGLNELVNELNPNSKIKTKTDILISSVRTSLNTTAAVDLQLLTEAETKNEINLPLGMRNLSVDFACSYFPSQKLTRYRYKLEGYSNEWTTLEKGENTASFTNLQSGTFILKVQCQSGISDWSAIKEIKIHVWLPLYESKWFLTVLVLLLALLTVFTVIFRSRQKQMTILKKMLETENLRLEKNNTILVEEVKDSNQQLLVKTAEVAHKNERLEAISELLAKVNRGTDVEKSKNLRELHRRLESELKTDEEWDDFKIYFDKNNQNYSEELLKHYPNLTAHDIRMSLLMRLKLTTKEIAGMLNITVLGVQKSRYRLKKRLNLEKEEDLYNFLNNFNVKKPKA